MPDNAIPEERVTLLDYLHAERASFDGITVDEAFDNIIHNMGHMPIENRVAVYHIAYGRSGPYVVWERRTIAGWTEAFRQAAPKPSADALSILRLLGLL